MGFVGMECLRVLPPRGQDAYKIQMKVQDPMADRTPQIHGAKNQTAQAARAGRLELVEGVKSLASLNPKICGACETRMMVQDQIEGKAHST